MKTFSLLVIFAFLTFSSLFSSSFPIQFSDLNRKLNENYLKNSSSTQEHSIQNAPNGLRTSPFPALKILKKLPDCEFIKKNADNHIQGTDSLFIGFGTQDTLVISSPWSQNGPIFIGNNGLLQIINTNATILGDIYIMGNGRLEISGSSVYLPQQYFYQRSILILQNGIFNATNTNFDYSSLSHNIVLTNHGTVNFKNVVNKGFTTNGLSGKPTYNIDGINEAGEFVMTDSINLNIKNSNTILLWHHFPKGSSLDYSFPNGDTLALYNCNNSIQGFTGINFNVHLENSTNVMWGLMPEDGTNLKISNSKIRTIGLWFTGNEKQSVSGLVDNASYSDYQPSLSDRQLRLINSSVQTWSIYSFNNAIVDLTGSIVGEIGSQGKSQILTSQAFCDGTGGYVWSTDTSFSIFGYSTATTAVRSEGNSFGLLGYSAINNGVASAVDNSNLFVIQTPLEEDPAAYQGGAVWLINLEKPSLANVDSKVPLIGSVWLDAGPLNHYEKFGHFKLEYRRNSDSIWTLLKSKISNEIRHDTIFIWNTTGLIPDQYVIQTTLFNSNGDSVQAVKTINLQPQSTSVAENYDIIPYIFPNPANEILNLSGLNRDELIELTISDIMGKLYKSYYTGNLNSVAYSNEINIQVSDLSTGIYLLNIKTKNGYRRYIFDILR